MKEYSIPESISKNDVKQLRKKMCMTQAEFASFANVSKKTVERWEISDKEITGPITTLFCLIYNDVSLMERLEIPSKKYPLLMKYFFRKQLCSVIDVDERNKKIEVYNYQVDYIYKAFGNKKTPSYHDYEEFLASRCIPRERDKLKIELEQWNIPFYDPMLIIEKTQGRMAEDEFWIEIER